MPYKVLNRFIEKEHGNELYEKGESYPKEGYDADPERVAFLQTSKNTYNRVFLGDEVEDMDLSQLSAAELKKVTNDDLREFLDKKGIDYKSSDDKADLIKLVLGEE